MMPVGTWNLAPGEDVDVQWSVASPVAVAGFAVAIAGNTWRVLADHLPSSVRSMSLTIPGDMLPGSYRVQVWAYVAGSTQSVSFGDSPSGTVRK